MKNIKHDVTPVQETLYNPIQFQVKRSKESIIGNSRHL